MPGSITITNPTGLVNKGENYNFPFAITAPDPITVTNDTVITPTTLGTGKLYSATVDKSSYIAITGVILE